MPTDFLHLTEQLERIHTGRLALRQVALSDAWPLYQATRNPLFNRHLLWGQPDEDQQVIDRVDAIMEASRRGRLSAVSAVVKLTGEWVSLFRFQPHARRPGTVEMGVWTHDRYWHGRVSFELGRACVDAAFALSGIAKLVGAASLHNKSSCRLMEMCGLSPAELVYRQSETGSEVELQEYEITRDEWAANRSKPMFQTCAERGSTPTLPASTPVREVRLAPMEMRSMAGD